MGHDTWSGRIWIEEGQIHYEWPKGSWQIPISELRVIGEHTDDHGPADDYFFLFLTDTHICEASFYADGRDEILSNLSDLLGAQIECGLTSSTDFDSRVMWPPDIEGKPFYDFVPVPRPKGFWAGLKHLLFPRVAYHITDVVKEKWKAVDNV